MQTFFNPTTPFFDGEGKPMVGARVSFLDVETSTSFISLTDNEGTALPNPLYTGSDGRLRLEGGDGAPAVPCVADGLSYKVVVARRTGVEPVIVGGILQNPDELYDEPYIAFVVTAMGGVGVTPDTTVLGSISDVRHADKNLWSVVCTGYYSAGDCPSRVFTWVDSVEPPDDNGINVLRNPDDATGYWMMGTPDSCMWDVRVAGLNTANETYVNAQRLTALLNFVNAQGTPVPTIYFPGGNWLLEGGFTCASLVMEKGANFKPADNVTDRTVTVDHFENRGGKFCAYDNTSGDSKRVLLKTPGTVRTSWFDGTINEFLIGNYLTNVDAIVFDNAVTAGTHSKTFTGKLVVVKNGSNIPTSLTFSESIIIDVAYKRITTPDATVGMLTVTNSEYQDADQNLHDKVAFYFGQTMVLEMNDEDYIHVPYALFDELKVVEAHVETLLFAVAKIDTDSARYIESDVDVELTGSGRRGEFAMVVNTKDGQINVTVRRVTNYMPTNFHVHFPLNSSNGVLMYCTDSYEEPGPTFPTGKLASWIPLAANVVLQRTEDA